MEIWEGTKNVRIPYILRTLVNFLVFFDFDFSDVIWPRYKCNGPIQETSKPYDAPKNFKKSKEMEIREGTKNVRIPHILRTLVNFLVFFDIDVSGYHLTTF